MSGSTAVRILNIGWHWMEFFSISTEREKKDVPAAYRPEGDTYLLLT